MTKPPARPSPQPAWCELVSPDPKPALPVHGAREFAAVSINNYSLEIEDQRGLVGDQASETAFREVLKGWQRIVEKAGVRPFGHRNADELSRQELDHIASGGDSPATRTLALAVDDFSRHLAYVVRQFTRHPAWNGVERIAVGGGFKESQIGRLAIRHAADRLHERGLSVQLRTLRHAADDGGLVGWASVGDPCAIGPAFLAVDIGGTNVRCGIVELSARPDTAVNGEVAPIGKVTIREKWRHADSEAPQPDLVEGIVDMLCRLIGEAEVRQIRLSPFIGIACPGLICADGSIERGAQNLPGDWSRASFHLPRRLQENIPEIGGTRTSIVMHNDAVVQGLSELPYMRDVQRWGALTIGTGLGNASYTNRRQPAAPAG